MSNLHETSAELVVTAPEPLVAELTYHIRCRTTVGVLTQLFLEAKHRVIIAAPFMQAGCGLSSGSLAEALRAALKRGVNVAVLSTGLGLKTIDRAGFGQSNTAGLTFFQPAEHLLDEQKLGSHAKFCVADGNIAYVGSANLTGRGLFGQFEMGVLVRGQVARQIEQFWDCSVELGLFVPVS